MTTKYKRYLITTISHILLSFIFILLYFHYVNYNYKLYAIGFLIISFMFMLKGAADFLYAVLSADWRRFHLFTAIHYLIIGSTLLLFNYFGIIYSAIFSFVYILFALSEFKYTRHPEEEQHRFLRHAISSLSKILIGNFFLFDFLFYNSVNTTTYGLLITLVGSLCSLFIIYSGVVVLEYLLQYKPLKLFLERLQIF